MRKILLIIGMMLLLFSCNRGYRSNGSQSEDSVPLKEHRMIKEITVNYTKDDAPNKYHGIYKQVFRKYNYKYKDSVSHEVRPVDIMHGIMYYINEYGDTVNIIYIDYTNYPRREE